MTDIAEPSPVPSDPTPGAHGGTGQPVTDIVEQLEETAQADVVSLGDAVASFGRRSFLPLLMVPALLVVSPLSGIPFFSSLCGLTIALVSAQMLWPGRDTLWLPAIMMRRRIEGARARAALDRLYKIAERLDTRSRERFCGLVQRPGSRVVEFACLICGCAMPFLEIVPFSSSLLGGAVVLMALGLLARDGLFALFGMLAMSVVFAGLFGVYSAFRLA